MKKKLTDLVCFCGILISAEPDAAQSARLLRAQEALAAGDNDRVVELLDSEWPGKDLAVRRYILGLALQETDPDGAEKAWRMALDLDPEKVSAGFALLQFLYGRERGGEAVDLARRMADCDPDDATRYRLLVYVLLRGGDSPLAEALWLRALTRFPDDRELRRLGVALRIQRDERGAARRLLTSLLLQDPTDGAAWRDLASLEEDPSAVRVALQAAVLASPEDRVLRRHFLQALLQGEQYQAALEQAEMLMAEGDDDDRLLSAQAAAQAGDFDKAGIWLGSPADDDPVAQDLAARLAVHLGDLPALRRACDALIAMGRAESGLLIRAAVLEREAGEHIRTEMLLGMALDDEAGMGDVAALHLAHLHLTEERPAAALDLLHRRFGPRPQAAEVAQLIRAARIRLETTAEP